MFRRSWVQILSGLIFSRSHACVTLFSHPNYCHDLNVDLKLFIESLEDTINNYSNLYSKKSAQVQSSAFLCKYEVAIFCSFSILYCSKRCFNRAETTTHCIT